MAFAGSYRKFMKKNIKKLLFLGFLLVSGLPVQARALRALSSVGRGVALAAKTGMARQGVPAGARRGVPMAPKRRCFSAPIDLPESSLQAEVLQKMSGVLAEFKQGDQLEQAWSQAVMRNAVLRHELEVLTDSHRVALVAAGAGVASGVYWWQECCKAKKEYHELYSSVCKRPEEPL
jgi:hypothetical protein